MKSLPLALLVLGIISHSAAADSPETAPRFLNEAKPATTSVAVSRRPALPSAPRETTPETSAKISEKLPKFSPPKPTARKKEDLPDLREIDKPRNTIIRLPKEIVEAKLMPRLAPEPTSADVVQMDPYIVQEGKLPRFKDRELLTPYGKLQEGLRRYPGLRFGSFGIFSNNGWALAKLEEDYRLERFAEFKDLAGLYTDPKAGASAKREVDQAFSHPAGPSH